jgi:hypothetical protein
MDWSRRIGSDEGCAQVLIYCGLGNPERAANSNRLQLARMDETINCHLGNAHNQGDLGYCQEPNVT